MNQLLQGRKTELVLGDNILIERLGEGGMGTVYKAKQRNLDRIAVIKTVRKEHLANPNAVQRFKQEARAVARLSHPNIVSVYDASEANGTHYLAMEFMEGKDLSKLVKERGPLPLASACECIRQAALGLQHAHEQGMVHRDIKPHNLLLNPGKGQVKILDMGLARLNTDPDATAAGLTASGTIVGTCDYMAPEQAEDSRHADIRADIYSLGCTLYFLLTAKVPFPGGDPLGKLLRHRADEPEPVEKLRAEVPAAVAAIVRKMMAKKPEARYQTPIEVVKAVTPLVAQFRRAKAASSAGGKLSAMGGAPPGATDTPPEEVPEEELSHTISEELSRKETSLDKGKIGRVVVSTLGRVTAKGASLWWRGVSQGSGRRRLTVAALSVLLPLLVWALWPGSRKPGPMDKTGPPGDVKVEKEAPPELPKKVVNSIGVEMILVPAGSFRMGAPIGEPGRQDDEGPQHDVEITQPFYMGAHEVTQGQYERVMNALPSTFKRNPNLPVETVSWNDATAFCEKLSNLPEEKKAGQVYRLPTEVEWEYACRAGSKTAFFCDPEPLALYAWFATNSEKKTHPVGEKKPNAWGLYDMSGNVWEWCSDYYDGKYYANSPIKDPKGPEKGANRILRGGSWDADVGNCRSARRIYNAPGLRNNYNFGFRVVAGVPPRTP